MFGKKRVYEKEFKLKLVKEHIEKGTSYWKLGKKYGIEANIIRRWGYTFETRGEEGLEHHDSNLCNYSAELKQKVVQEYLAGGITQKALASKYGILAPSTINLWVKVYNNHEELTDSRLKGEYLMVKDNTSRKTTLEERITIVEYCTANANNYALAAKEFNCSYNQVYFWVKKYETHGVDGLYDRRGRSKPIEELTDVYLTGCTPNSRISTYLCVVVLPQSPHEWKPKIDISLSDKATYRLHMARYVHFDVSASARSRKHIRIVP